MGILNAKPAQSITKLVAIVGSEATRLAALRRRIDSFGYASIEFNSLPDLHAAILDGRNFDALIVAPDLDATQDYLETIRRAAEAPMLLVAPDDEMRSLPRFNHRFLISENTDVLFANSDESELGLRLDSLIERSRRARYGAQEDLYWGTFQFVAHEGRFLCDGREVVLAARERALARMFFRNLGNLVSRESIVVALWGVATVPHSRSVDVHIARIRKKLGLKPENGAFLVAVYKQGYRLTLGKEAHGDTD